MAKFKCKNCGKVFDQFCDNLEQANMTRCPYCESHWTEIIDNNYEFVFPTLPYSDPYIRPNIKPTDWTITCRTCDINGN